MVSKIRINFAHPPKQPYPIPELADGSTVTESEPPAEPPPASVLKAGDRWVDPQGVPMVYVPPGTFRMGNDGSDQNDEKPAHRVNIPRGFWLDLTPVTNAAYAKFVADGGYRNRDLWTQAGWDWLQRNKITGPEQYAKFAGDHQPRVFISWFESYAYAKWRGGRLPTEAEWEWAARGAENRLFPWGNQFDSKRVVFEENARGQTAEVGEGIRSAGASWVGALDMSGNVWEWVNSLHKVYPYNAADGREISDGAFNRILRGGSWYSAVSGLRTTARYFDRFPAYRNYYGGCRICIPAWAN